jgi:hypothetical protein
MGAFMFFLMKVIVPLFSTAINGEIANRLYTWITPQSWSDTVLDK